ncbi:MAG: NADH-quinone oxidoreductase subunit H [Sulfobacillus thermotolerans]|nr:NADH-quinone oxidoreductase subunit H [Sulfobacillus thermotolerans]
MEWWGQAISMAASIALAPLLVGLSQTTKARIQGRMGPSVFQAYRILWKTWHKETTVPQDSSWIFRLAPSVNVATMLVIVTMLPWTGKLPSSWPHNALVLFFLLAVERFWSALAGMDSAGAFGGLGASRVSTVGSGIEPALLAAFGVLWVVSGHTAIAPLAPWLRHQALGILPWILAASSYVLVLLAETGRLPVDNPDTHLELTMMHEATVLEYNGRFLAEQQMAGALKFTALIGLGWIYLGPVMSSVWANLFMRVGELVVTSMALGWAESRFVKLRYFQLPTYFAMATGVGLLAFYLVASGSVS